MFLLFFIIKIDGFFLFDVWVFVCLLGCDFVGVGKLFFVKNGILLIFNVFNFLLEKCFLFLCSRIWKLVFLVKVFFILMVFLCFLMMVFVKDRLMFELFFWVYFVLLLVW